eukprot:CAMPEP_0180767070 /NCGR_PEP_ID=MMETSP1038_2-20121128/39824_1 /TAXON_ID=632150 /ORGANISM="Azadinium spinosum, Strain 3D9" /LENGTH=103 /DNA_ID=CAMNT_0022801607 /DNA_START=970 /DNA_END=1281 /DNA_ORIENTATION=-
MTENAYNAAMRPALMFAAAIRLHNSAKTCGSSLSSPHQCEKPWTSAGSSSGQSRCVTNSASLSGPADTLPTDLSGQTTFQEARDVEQALGMHWLPIVTSTGND